MPTVTLCCNNDHFTISCDKLIGASTARSKPNFLGAMFKIDSPTVLFIGGSFYVFLGVPVPRQICNALLSHPLDIMVQWRVLKKSFHAYKSSYVQCVTWGKDGDLERIWKMSPQIGWEICYLFPIGFIGCFLCNVNWVSSTFMCVLYLFRLETTLFQLCRLVGLMFLFRENWCFQWVFVCKLGSFQKQFMTK